VAVCCVPDEQLAVEGVAATQKETVVVGKSKGCDAVVVL
jgi:hypothetical protein